MKRDYDVKHEIDTLKAISLYFFGTTLKIDQDNENVIIELIHYFNVNEQFQTGNHKLSKGILLVGKIGSGKSLLMKIFKKYCYYIHSFHQFRIVTVDEITDLYMSKGVEGINLFIRNKQENSYGIPKPNPISICLDDIGTEKETTKYYGTDENVIDMLLNQRYDIYQNNRSIITHVTTNLDPKKLKERYGKRNYSRIKEMFNYIHLPGTDRRNSS